MLVEGSYPYVVGGVPSWIQMLMEGFPEYEFFIYAMGAEAKDRGKYKYKFPANVAGIQEVFLDEILSCKSPSLQENILSEAERSCIYDLVMGEKPIDIGAMAEIFQHKGRMRSPLVIGGVVRVVPIKDIITMLRAFLLVQQVFPDAELKVIGPYGEDKEYYEMCCQTVETLQLRNVEFTGSVNVAEYLPKLDIMVLSSISEGQPLAVLEGQAARRPFVTTNVGCCRELIYGATGDELGTAGAVVAPMDYRQMAKEIIRLGRDFELRRRMGNIGYQRVENGYTYENFINSYREIYGKYERPGD